MSALQSQVGGYHYIKLAIQPAEYSTRNGLGHMAGDAIAYITRYKDKNGKEDLLKAIQSIQILIELEYPEEKVEKVEKVEKKPSIRYWVNNRNGRLLVRDWRESFESRYMTGPWHEDDFPDIVREDYVPISETEARKLVEQAGGVW